MLVKRTLDATYSHTRAGSDQSREGLAVGSHQFTTLARVGLWCVEVKDELLVVRQKGEAVDGRVRKEELSCKAQARVLRTCCSRR